MDVVWHRKEMVVKDEIRVILREKGFDVDELTAKEIFENRISAAKRVYDRLSPDERALVEKECIEENTASPPDVQRR